MADAYREQIPDALDEGKAIAAGRLEDKRYSHTMKRFDDADFYFAYGSNMSTERLRARIPQAAPMGRARSGGLRLVFNKIGADGSGKANLVEDSSTEAWGVVFAIPTRDWTNLDRFEPGYARVVRRVTFDSGESLAAQIYLGTGTTRKLPPHDWYRDHLLRGAVEHGFPAEIVRMIRVLQR
ncbi:MAG: gamma-glutamylcyclotransferase [bacterium]|nr:gamma-glutamylcyclotransferase [bacterium]